MKKIKEVLERAIFLVIGMIIVLVLLGGRGPETTFASPQPQGSVANEAMIFELWEGYADIQQQNATEFGEFVAGVIPPHSQGKVFQLWKGYADIQEQNAIEFGEFVDGVVAPLD